MAKIDRVENLPEWFDLEKYRGCENFGAVEWLASLDIRSYLLSGNPDYPDLGSIPDELLTDIGYSQDLFMADMRNMWKINLQQRHAEALRSDPLGYLPPEDEFSKWKLQLRPPVRSAVFGDLATALHLAIDSATHDSAEEIHSQLQGWGYIDHDIQAGAWFLEQARKDREPTDTSKIFPRYMVVCEELRDTAVEPLRWGALLSVDLLASDAVLLESFKAWVKEARASQQTFAGKRRKSLYDRWARYGLLPYLDLLIWSMETETRIPDRVMSAAISSYDAGEANLRKTIAPLAADLMRDLSELQALAAVEAAANGSAKPETFED